MSSDPAAAGNEGIALALAFARAPGQFPELLYGRRRLPPGVTALLQVAAGSPLADAESALSGAVSGEPQQAAQFFIEQVLLAHSADHYRVLGVDPTAPAEKIKEHHRLLIRLFHPDRQLLPDARTDAFATRINRAYNVLRSPDTRASYDLTLMEKHAVKRQIKPPPRGQYFAPVPDLPLHPPSFVTRHRTVFALGSVALAAALGVVLVYVNREPTGAIGANGNQFTRSSGIATLRLAPPELPPAIVRALAESDPVQLPPGALTAVDDKPDETPIPVAENRREREPVVMPAAVKTANTRLAPPVMAVPESIPERLPPPPRPTAAVAGAIGATAAVDPPTVPEIKPERLRPEQLNGLVANLSEQYQRGDLENLLALFDASAHMERGDKKQIRAEYSELFRNSESRVLYIWDVAWSGDGKLTRGEGSFQTRVLRKGDGSPQIRSGAVTIEVIQRNDRPLIVGLYHKADH
jgi:DnaJ-domain-containing protein 1